MKNLYRIVLNMFFSSRFKAASRSCFLNHIQLRHSTVRRTPLDEGSARRKDLYLTLHTTLTRERYSCPRWDFFWIHSLVLPLYFFPTFFFFWHDCHAFLLLSSLYNTCIRAPAGFKLAIPASKRPQAHDLGLVATGIGRNSTDLIVNRTDDLPACSAVPQLTAPPRKESKSGQFWRTISTIWYRDCKFFLLLKNNYLHKQIMKYIHTQFFLLHVSAVNSHAQGEESRK
jgi:hypothetical protein